MEIFLKSKPNFLTLQINHFPIQLSTIFSDPFIDLQIYTVIYTIKNALTQPKSLTYSRVSNSSQQTPNKHNEGPQRSQTHNPKFHSDATSKISKVFTLINHPNFATLNSLQSKQPSFQLANQFTKFKAFDDKQEDLQKIVTNQRIQISRETKGRIKLFNNSKINSVVGQNNSQLPFSLTQQTQRPTRRFYGNHKTISNDSPPTQPKPPLFISENLGPSMNNYLNIYLHRSTEIQSQEQQKQKQKEEIPALSEERNCHTIDLMRKKNNVAFVKRMKKQHKSRTDDNTHELFSEYRSQQLVKPNTAKPPPKTELASANCTQQH